MKQISKLLLLVFLACGLHIQAYAQVPELENRGMELSEEDKAEFQQRIADLVKEFQGYLTKIANDKNAPDIRQSAKKAALNLFIGKGESYQFEEIDGSYTSYDPVKMWTSSKYNNRVRAQRMTTYLDNLYALGNRYIIKIQSVDAVRVDNINSVGNGRYVAMAYFVQKYYRYTKDGQLIYTDETTKKVKIYINPIEVGDGIVWKPYMGDVYVVETR